MTLHGKSIIAGTATDSSSGSFTATSVGAAAILRFVRPVAYQNFPQAALPIELQDANPRRIWRLVDGQLSKEPLQYAG
jgi:2,5-dioxopentanoate dehydrogenase